MFTRVKNEEEIKNMRISGQMLASVLAYLKKCATEGMTTKELADLGARELKKLGGKPPFLGYNGFPDVICISRNDEVVHGIPGASIIENGDLLSLDFGVTYNGMITDSAITICIGDSTGEKRKLIKGTEEALMAGIDAVSDNVRTGDIGESVEKVMIRYGFGIVRDLVGHGVGHQLHEEPDIPNYGTKGTGKLLHAGMTIAIEPMSTLGSEKVILESDGWTVKTYDGSLSAHFEHTVLITPQGAEIITV